MASTGSCGLLAALLVLQCSSQADGMMIAHGQASASWYRVIRSSKVRRNQKTAVVVDAFDPIMWRHYPSKLTSVYPGTAEGHIPGRNAIGRPSFSSRGWATILWSTPSSGVLHHIQGLLLAVVAWSLAIWALYSKVLSLPALSFKPHNLIGSALSLLLVFRTNSSYTRFWEGRKCWQNLSDSVRSLARMVTLYRDQVGEKRCKRVARLLCAFPIVLKQYLRGADVMESSVVRLLTESDKASLRQVSNKPLLLCNLLGQQIAVVPDLDADGSGGANHGVPFSSRERLAMLQQVQALSNCVGACERIVQTPVPLHYARHTFRIAILFIFTLPFVLVRELGFVLIPTMALICWVFMGIQEIGMMIEEPFREILQLDAMCSAIQRDVEETYASSLLPTEVKLDLTKGGFSTKRKEVSL